MYKQMKRVLTLVLVFVMITGSVSVALPIQPSRTQRLEYLGKVMDLIDEYYVDEVDINTLLDGAFKGVFEELDLYSTYFTEEEYKQYNEAASGVFGGIGVTVTEDEATGYIKVISPIEGTPGDRANIKPGDLIIAVNGNEIRGLALEDAVDLMRGEPGTKVRLELYRPATSDRFEVDIVREVIEINPVRMEVREDGIVNFRLTSFNEHSARDVREALEALKGDRTIKGIVIDLRNNPGGRLDQVVEIADMFLEKGVPIVKIESRAFPDETTLAEDQPLVKLPLAVLINEGSASASEILAGALQDNGAAVVVGVTSFGKGTVQRVMDLSSGAGLKLTIAEYLTGGGHKVNGVGITPDVVVENSYYAGYITNEDLAPMIEAGDSVLGDKGLNVYGAQERLAILGFTVKPTGIFNEETKQALLSFQKEMGLPASGILDQATRTALTLQIDNPTLESLDRQFMKAIELLLK